MVDHCGRVITIEVNMEKDPLHWIQCIIAVTMGPNEVLGDDKSINTVRKDNPPKADKADDPLSDDPYRFFAVSKNIDCTDFMASDHFFDAIIQKCVMTLCYSDSGY